MTIHLGSSHNTGPSRSKAKKLLKDKTVRGKKITKKQKGLFGLIAGGKKPTRRKKKK